MTKHWTIIAITFSSLLFGCGENNRKQLTGVKRPPALAEALEVEVKNVEPVKTKVEHLIESNDIQKNSQLKTETIEQALSTILAQKIIYTGFIINAYNTETPFRGEILTLAISPTDEEGQSEIQIINGRGNQDKLIVVKNKQSEIIIDNYEIRLHMENDCLIIERKEDYTGVVCANMPIKEEKQTEENKEETTEKENNTEGETHEND